MKKTVTLLAIAFGLFKAGAQSISVSDFETFTLAANSAYSPTVSNPFQAGSALFDYKYNSYWSGGFAYTNIYDSSTAGYMNMYGVKAYKGFNGSSIFVVGQDGGKIILSAPQTTVEGFYLTNTTYAYKSMAAGDQFARKFGDTTGTGSGTTIPQGSYPDYFKVVIKGYKNGGLKTDSITAFLADFTSTNNAQDYIVNSWKFISTSAIGEVDSIKFVMRSSDTGPYGINTPAYFAIDNFTIESPVTTGIPSHQASNSHLSVYPNPFSKALTIKNTSDGSNAMITDINGKLVYTSTLTADENRIDLEGLQNGIYFLHIRSGEQITVMKLIKN